MVDFQDNTNNKDNGDHRDDLQQHHHEDSSKTSFKRDDYIQDYQEPYHQEQAVNPSQEGGNHHLSHDHDSASIGQGLFQQDPSSFMQEQSEAEGIKSEEEAYDHYAMERPFSLEERYAQASSRQAQDPSQAHDHETLHITGNSNNNRFSSGIKKHSASMAKTTGRVGALLLQTFMRYLGGIGHVIRVVAQKIGTWFSKCFLSFYVFLRMKPFISLACMGAVLLIGGGVISYYTLRDTMLLSKAELPIIQADQRPYKISQENQVNHQSMPLAENDVAFYNIEAYDAFLKKEEQRDNQGYEVILPEAEPVTSPSRAWDAAKSNEKQTKKDNKSQPGISTDGAVLPKYRDKAQRDIYGNKGDESADQLAARPSLSPMTQGQGSMQDAGVSQSNNDIPTPRIMANIPRFPNSAGNSTDSDAKQAFIEKNASAAKDQAANAQKEYTGKRYWVQVVSLSSKAASLRMWEQYRAKHPRLFAAYHHKIVRVKVKNRIFYRLLVGHFVRRSDAVAFCNRLKAKKIDCLIRME